MIVFNHIASRSFSLLLLLIFLFRTLLALVSCQHPAKCQTPPQTKQGQTERAQTFQMWVLHRETVSKKKAAKRNSQEPRGEKKKIPTKRARAPGCFIEPCACDLCCFFGLRVFHVELFSPCARCEHEFHLSICNTAPACRNNFQVAPLSRKGVKHSPQCPTPQTLSSPAHISPHLIPSCSTMLHAPKKQGGRFPTLIIIVNTA